MAAFAAIARLRLESRADILSISPKPQSARRALYVLPSLRRLIKFRLDVSISSLEEHSELFKVINIHFEATEEDLLLTL